MRNISKYMIISFSLVLYWTNNSLGQGCSDAGFCTINSFKPSQEDTTKSKNNQCKIGGFFGSADHDIAVYGGYIEYNRQLSDKMGVDVKLTTIAQNGNDISVFGISDLFLNVNYKANKNLSFTLGTKLPFNTADQTQENNPLPMDYQSSLGTFDLIFGLGYTIHKLHIVAAIQQPLTQNDNQFLAIKYPTPHPFSNFQTTNNFTRASDILLRISYPVPLSQKLSLTPSLLPIYHLANDKYTDDLGIEKEIDGSLGLTLNGNVYLDYEISTNNFIQLNAGMPFVVRDARPDGLTRSFIANVEYRMRF
ncbi:MAG: hypothetical protein WAT79_08175 [Saprospiraceae bacterium]